MAYTPPDAGPFRGVLAVTAAYFVVYYALMTLQIKGKKHARGASGLDRAGWNRATDLHPIWVMADRSFLNALEQQVAFLLPLWLHAVFVCPTVSAYVGAVAVVSRLLFPIFWSVKGGWNLLIEASTQPYYMCVCYFLGALLTVAAADVNIVSETPSWALPLLVLGYYVAIMLVVYPLGTLLYKITVPGFAAAEAAAAAEGVDASKEPLTGAPKQGTE